MGRACVRVHHTAVFVANVAIWEQCDCIQLGHPYRPIRLRSGVSPPTLTRDPQPATINGSGQPRPPVRPRYRVPASGGRFDRAHARRLGDGVRGRRADAQGADRPRAQPAAPGAALSPAAGVRAARPGTAGVDRRSALQPALPHPPHRAAAARGRGGAQAARRAAVLPAPGSLQAAVGDLARAAHGRSAVRADRQDPPRARRRDLRAWTSRPSCSTPRPSRPARRGRRRRGRPSRCPGPAKLLGEALVERATVPAEMGRGARALLRAPRKVASQLSRTASRASARPRSPASARRRRPARSTSISARTAATRSSTPTSPSSRRSRTRSGARSTTSCLRPSASPSGATCARRATTPRGSS